MKRSRLVVIGAGSVVGLGLALALGALVFDPARASVGPLPAEGLVLPADARFVMGLDVKRFVASPFYQRYASQGGKPDSFGDLQEKTGLDPARDVDQVIIAGRPDQGENGAVVLVRGRFDRYKLTRSIETSGKNVTSKKHEGTAIYLFGEGRRGAKAIAFLGNDDDLLVMGSQKAVEAAVSSHFQGQTPLKQNAELLALLERVKPGSTFWVVGDQSLLAQMPGAMPGGGAGAGMKIPSLKGLTVTGELDPLVSLDVIGDAADPAGATQLAQIVQGLVALASLQAAQKPELAELPKAFSVTTEGSSVHLSARLPYALMDALHGRKSAGVTPPAAN
jgi:hypothetical protein